MSTAIKIDGPGQVFLSRVYIEGYDVAIEAGPQVQLVADQVHVRGDQAEHLKGNFRLLGLREKFIALETVDDELIADAVKKVVAAGEGSRADALKKTQLGERLAKEKFTDWARLAIDLARLLHWF